LGDFDRETVLAFLGDFDRVARLGLFEAVLRPFLGVITVTASATAAPTIIPGEGRGAIIETTSGFCSIPSSIAFTTGFLETRLEAIRLGDLDRDLEAMRLRDMERRLGDLEALRLRDMERDLEALRLRDMDRDLEALRLRDMERRLGDLEVLRLGDLDRDLRLGTRGDTAPAAIFTGRVTTATVVLRTEDLRLGDFDRETGLRLGDLERVGIFILVYK